MTVSTDADGRFTVFAMAGYPFHIMVTAPEGFAQPRFGLNFPGAPAGVAEFALPPVELSRAGTVRGIVVDERGEPVAGAEIVASWPVNEGPNAESRQERRAIAGRRGEFLIGGVVAEAPVDLSAVAPDGRRTSRSVGSRPGAEPARLVLDSSDLVSLAGRVVDASGHRVAGAKVHLRVQLRDLNRQVIGDTMVRIHGAYVIQTNDTGWYRTPLILDPQLAYAAFVEADGFEPARTNWTRGNARTFPELTLRPSASERLSAVEGSLKDRGGQPVAGAAVWTTEEAGTPIRTTADAGGRFRIDNVPARGSFLFVEAAGFRSFGRVMELGTGSLSIALTRSDERPAAAMTALPPARPRAEERALARRVILPYAERAVKEGDESSRLRSLEVLALSDPARVLEVIETGIFANPWFNDYLRRACARALWEDSRAEALAVVEAMQAAEWRARGHLDACDALKPMAAEGRRGSRGLEVHDAAIIAAALVPVAERIDPALVPEFFWRVASFRVTPKPQMDAAARPDARLALLLARYDRDAAKVVLRPILDRGPTADDIKRTGVVQAVEAIDPARAVALVEALPEDSNAEFNPFKNVKSSARVNLAAFLGRPPGERCNKVTERLIYLRIVGNEDAF